MKLKNMLMLTAVILTAFASVTVSSASDVAVDGGPAFQTLERIETIVYGSPQEEDFFPDLTQLKRSLRERSFPEV